MGYEDRILEHYRKEAISNGLGKESTMKDFYIRDMEIKYILSEIDTYHSLTKSDLKILDVGCGNGFLMSILCEKYLDFNFWGLEFTKELYDLAKSRKLMNATIQYGDCRKRNFEAGFFDLVISERVLINLLNQEDKLEAIKEIHRTLKSNGLYIMIEAFHEPLENLNKARKELLLTEIEPAYHNEYFDIQIIDKMREMGFVEGESIIPPNFLSTHFFITRILHETIRPEGGTIKNTEYVKFFDLALPSAIGNYSPILFKTFKKVK